MTKRERAKEEVIEVKRLLGLHPIVDAKSILRFVIKKSHVDSAVMGDFQNCAMAVALKNITGVSAGVVVFPTTVYVPWDKNGDGNFIIERYCQQSRSKRSIGQYDTTGTFPLGEYILTPPSRTASIKGQRKIRKQRRADSVKRAADKKHRKEYRARIKTEKLKKQTEQNSQMSFLEIRRGSGRAALVRKSLIKDPIIPSPTIGL